MSSLFYEGQDKTGTCVLLLADFPVNQVGRFFACLGKGTSGMRFLGRSLVTGVAGWQGSFPRYDLKGLSGEN